MELDSDFSSFLSLLSSTLASCSFSLDIISNVTFVITSNYRTQATYNAKSTACLLFFFTLSVCPSAIAVPNKANHLPAHTHKVYPHPGRVVLETISATNPGRAGIYSNNCQWTNTKLKLYKILLNVGQTKGRRTKVAFKALSAKQ